ncbi:hypothetical protein B0A48_01280 [Cryoendolithus antarcticus]|uniref:Uncharacterized protein n=1 Tax=Cryoendolithus antarcticus TaxID=1507870 RepID=A0A1V8TSV6_9PEZI|nr:hypothetical protein B0A48_01280 [Cryoendolithus antarcticus]
MAEASASSAMTIDDNTAREPNSAGDALVVSDPSIGTRLNAAERVFGITELLEDILLLAITEPTRREELCWLFTLQTLNKSFAHTILQSLPLQRTTFRTYALAPPPAPT